MQIKTSTTAQIYKNMETSNKTKKQGKHKANYLFMEV